MQIEVPIVNKTPASDKTELKMPTRNGNFCTSNSYTLITNE